MEKAKKRKYEKYGQRSYVLVRISTPPHPPPAVTKQNSIRDLKNLDYKVSQ